MSVWTDLPRPFNRACSVDSWAGVTTSRGSGGRCMSSARILSISNFISSHSRCRLPSIFSKNADISSNVPPDMAGGGVCRPTAGGAVAAAAACGVLVTVLAKSVLGKAEEADFLVGGLEDLPKTCRHGQSAGGILSPFRLPPPLSPF